MITLADWPNQVTPDTSPLTFTVARHFTASADAAVVAGLAAGPLVAWLLTAWTLQRRLRHGPAVRAAIFGSGLLVIMFVLLWAFVAAIVVAVRIGAGDGWSVDTCWLCAMLPYVPPAPAVSVATALITLALAALPTGRAPTIDPSQLDPPLPTLRHSAFDAVESGAGDR